MAEIEPWWKNPMLTSLEQILQDKAPEWKYVSSMNSDDDAVRSEWRKDDSRAVIHLIRKKSPEEASFYLHAFAWHIPLTPSLIAQAQRDPSNFQLPQPIMPDATLPDLGDENFVWTQYDDHGNSLIKLRVGRIVMEVDCSSYVIGKWLAHLVAEGMS